MKSFMGGLPTRDLFGVTDRFYLASVPASKPGVPNGDFRRFVGILYCFFFVPLRSIRSDSYFVHCNLA